MTLTAARPRTTRPRLRRVRLLAALGPLVALSWAGAYAAFTDSVDAGSAFSTGTVDIQADGSDGPVSFTSLAVSGLLPGATKYAKLAVSNAGTSAFTYGMTTTTTGSAPLAAALQLGVRTIAGSTCDAAAYSGGTVWSADAVGLSSTGVSGRSLSAGASETLCFRLQLPSGAGNALQGTSTTATFGFTATS